MSSEAINNEALSDFFPQEVLNSLSAEVPIDDGGFGGEREPEKKIKEDAVDDEPRNLKKIEDDEAEPEKPKTLEEILDELEREKLGDKEGNGVSGGKAEYSIELDGKKIDLSQEDFKKFATEGYKYKQEIDNLAQRKADWDTEVNNAVAKLEEKYSKFDEDIKVKKTMDLFAEDLKAMDPGFYEELQEKFREYHRRTDNPVINSQVSALERKIQDLEQRLQGKSVLDGTKQLVTEIESFKEKHQPTFKKLGLEIDWKKVGETWKVTGLPVSKVVNAIYGEDLNKVYQSKLKLRDTQLKLTKKSTPSSGRSYGKSTAKDPFKGMNDLTQIMQTIGQDPGSYLN